MKQQPKVDPSLLKLLEQDFERVYQSMITDSNFIRFKGNYLELLEMLKISHSQEQCLNQKCGNIKDNMIHNSHKIKQILKIAEEDSQQIVSLKNNLEESKRLFLVKKQENKSKNEKIENLNKMWKNLEILMKQNKELNSEKLNQYNLLLSQKMSLGKDLNQLRNEIDQLIGSKQQINQENREKKILINDQQTELELYTIQTIQLKKQLVKAINKYNDTVNTRNNLKESIELIKANIEDKMQLYYEKDEIYGKIKEDQQRNQQMYQSHKIQQQKVQKILMKKNGQLEAMMVELNYLQEIYKKLLNQISGVKSVQNQQNKQQRNNVRVIDDKEQLLEHLKEKERVLEDQIKHYKNSIVKFNNKIEKIKNVSKQEETSIKKLHLVSQDIESNNNNLINNNQVNIEKIETLENFFQKLQEEYQEESSKAKSYTNKIDHKKILHQQLQEKINQIYQNMVIVKQKIEVKMGLIDDQKLHIKSQKEILKGINDEYQVMRHQNNQIGIISKEVQDSASEMKRKIKAMMNQTEQFKEEIVEGVNQLKIETLRKEEELKTLKQKKKSNRMIAKKLEQKRQDYKTNLSYMNKIKDISQILQNQIRAIEEKKGRFQEQSKRQSSQLEKLNRSYSDQKNQISQQEIVLTKSNQVLIEFNQEQKYLDILYKETCHSLRLCNQNLNQMYQMQKKLKNINQKIIQEKLKVKSLNDILENPDFQQKQRIIGQDTADIYDIMKKVRKYQNQLINASEKMIFLDLENEKLSKEIQITEEKIKDKKLLKKKQRMNKTKIEHSNMITKIKSLMAEINMYTYKMKETHDVNDRQKTQKKTLLSKMKNFKKKNKISKFVIKRRLKK